MALEFSKQANYVWHDGRRNNRTPAGAITEILVSIEVLDKTFDLYGKTDRDIIQSKNDVEFVFWKQLNTDLRKWIKVDYKKSVTENGQFHKNILKIQSRFRPIYEGKR